MIPSLERAHLSTNSLDGYILFSPMASATTYQMDYHGNIIHTWPSSNFPGYAVYPLGNGTIIRAARHNNKIGGMVQKIAWNGTPIWQYIYDSGGKLSHHDIEPLPNGNVLMIAWEFKTLTETLEAGRNPNLQPTGPLTPDHIVEVKPTGPTSGDIVWEWHVWDHLIQDFDPSKANYGVVANHPELIDINYVSQHTIEISDWTHLNAIDYNENLDQIMVSSWYFNEFWVIDHSMTTALAAGHTGGRYGRGGDLLYRWGNPQTYRSGTAADQKFFGQHDAQWIEAGCPGYSNILVFNNGLDRPQGRYSSVEELRPPINSNGTYNYTTGQAYQPADSLWVYTAPIPTDFYSPLISGCQRLPNGDTLICSGENGIFFQVTPDKQNIWQYTNPYPTYLTNQVFKIRYIPPIPPGPDLEGEGSLQWKRVSPGSLRTGSFTVRNIGDSSSKLNWSIVSYPDWGNWSFTPASGHNLTPEEGPVSVQVEMIAPSQQGTHFTGEIKLVNLQNSEDYDFIPVSLATPVEYSYRFPWFHHNGALFRLLLSLWHPNH